MILKRPVTAPGLPGQTNSINNNSGANMNWYIKVLKNYAVFSGRAQRTEYWMFVLFNFIITLALAFLDSAINNPGVLTGLYSLAVLIPSLAVLFRRLHDTGRSGWWVLILLVPVIGAIVILVFLVLASEEGENDYGPNPLV
jgi:uncharacterized membrane protein YhaH (DUF805 family)